MKKLIIGFQSEWKKAMAIGLKFWNWGIVRITCPQSPPPQSPVPILTVINSNLGYYMQSFRLSAVRFQDCLRFNPIDTVAQIYRQRCQRHFELK